MTTLSTFLLHLPPRFFFFFLFYYSSFLRLRGRIVSSCSRVRISAHVILQYPALWHRIVWYFRWNLLCSSSWHSWFLRNVGKHVPNRTVSQPRRHRYKTPAFFLTLFIITQYIDFFHLLPISLLILTSFPSKILYNPVRLSTSSTRSMLHVQ